MTSSIVPVESSIFVEEGKSLNLTAVAVGTNVHDLIYEWNFGDDSASIQGGTVLHRYHLAGHYPLRLIVRDDKGAISIIEKTAIVETMPLVVTNLTSYILDEAKGIVAFEAAAAASNIDNSFADKQITSTQTASNQIATYQTTNQAVNYIWNFGDGGSPASGQKAIHKFAQSGTYYVSVIASSASGATAAQVHKVTLNKVVQDSPIKNNKEVLQDYPITFNSPFTDKNILSTHTIRWDFGDGTTVENKLAPEHVYRQVGSYIVSLEITDEKGSTTNSNIPVKVVPAVSKILSLSANPASTLGEPTDFAAIIDNPNDEALTYRWDFGDGSKKSYSKEAKGKQVSYIYTEEGTYTVTLTVDSPAGSHVVESIPITISSIPQIESIACANKINRNEAVDFSAIATSGQKDSLTYQWQFKRNSQDAVENSRKRTDENTNEDTEQKIGQTVSFPFLESGDWSVTLTVIAGTKTAVETFNVFVAEHKLAINVQAKENILVGRSAEFQGYVDSHSDSRTDGAPTSLRKIDWDFGDGTTVESETLAASHIYQDAGSYTVGLSVTNEFGATATDFVGVNVVKPPLILMAGGRVLLRKSDSSRLESTAMFELGSADRFCSYSGEALTASDSCLVAIPEVSSAASRMQVLSTKSRARQGLEKEDTEGAKLGAEIIDKAESIENLGAIAISQANLDRETISEVQADDSVQYQQKDAMSLDVPQHHDLVSDILLRTSSIGYNPTRIDIRSHKKQLKTAAGWNEFFSPGESANHPRVIEVERGPLVIPRDVTLKNIVIVVNRGDISFEPSADTSLAAENLAAENLAAEDCAINNATLIAQNGAVDLSTLNAVNIKVFSSKAIQTTRRSHFQGNSLLASQQSVVFNGTTVGTDALLKIVSQQKVRFNASQPTQSQILANAEVELCQGTTLQGSVRTKDNVVFNDRASLYAALRPSISKSFKTVTLAEPELETAIELNIRLPQSASHTVDSTQLVVRVVEIPSDQKGILQLADGSPLFPGKQLTGAELEEVSFTPVSETAEETSRFVYTIEDSWNPPTRQTLNIRFNAVMTPVNPAQRLSTQPSVLWPPQHQMIEVKVEGFEQFGPGTAVTLDSIACSEPICAKGEGNDYDYEVREANRIFLRALQPKNGAGRLYKLIYQIVDSLGTTYSAVEVPTMLSANIYRIER
jgi:PKD repeat protein